MELEMAISLGAGVFVLGARASKGLQVEITDLDGQPLVAAQEPVEQELAPALPDTDGHAGERAGHPTAMVIIDFCFGSIPPAVGEKKFDSLLPRRVEHPDGLQHSKMGPWTKSRAVTPVFPWFLSLFAPFANIA